MHKRQQSKCKACLKREAGSDGLCDHCRYIQLSKPIDKKKLPWIYRLIFNLPGVHLIENASGAYWAMVAPILFFLNILLSLFLLIYFSFPINLILVAVIPVSILLIFIKLSLERFINFWNLLVTKSGFKWNVEEITQEYVTLLKKQKKIKKYLSED